MPTAPEYKLISGTPAALQALVQTEINGGWAPVGVPYVSTSGTDLEQVMIRQIGSASDFTFSFPITAVVQDIVPPFTGSFTVAGNQTKYLNVGFRFTVVGSTGNNGTYTVVTAVYGANTVITVKEAVPSAVADGTILLYSAS